MVVSIPLILQKIMKKAAPRIQIENGGLQRRVTESIHEYADSPDFGERRACVNSGRPFFLPPGYEARSRLSVSDLLQRGGPPLS